MKKRLLTITILTVGLLSFALGIYADAIRQEITATLCKDIKITLDGEEYVARDANKQIVYPIIYNGTTYLPVRAVANMYDSNVTWDNGTRTVGLWSSGYVPEESEYLPETEMNNSIKNANSFELNSKMEGTVGDIFADTSDQDEYDYFKIVIEEAGVITFTVNADDESGLEFELRSRDDELYDNADLTDNDLLNYETAIDPGTYYACVVSDTKVTYKIENNFESFNNASENNNEEKSFASNISLNTEIKGSLNGFQEYSATDSVDYYKFEEPLDSISIELNHTGIVSMRVYIYNTSGETLESYDSSFGKINETYIPTEEQIGLISIEGGKNPYELYTIKISE